MKCFRYCCCLLCALVLSSTVFSINVHAKVQDVPEYEVEHIVSLSKNGSNVFTKSFLFSPFNNVYDKKIEEEHTGLINGNTYLFRTSYELITDKPPFVSKGSESVVTLFEAYYGFGLTNTLDDTFSYMRGIDEVKMLIHYSDETYQYADNTSYTLYGGKITLKGTFTPRNDVKSIKFIIDYTKTFSDDVPLYTLSTYLGEIFGADSGYNLSIDQESQETGLLKSLINKVNDFKDSVSNGVSNLINGIKDVKDNIVSGFADMVSNIKELPSKIWNLISEGLKNLFVPDEDFIVQYKEDMNDMLEDKLGAVYQVVNITLESWDRIGASDEQNTIELPETTINLPENNKFSFGGYDVKIVPDGFSVLADAIKLIGGICVTILFVNGLRKRYDEVMGVEK